MRRETLNGKSVIHETIGLQRLRLWSFSQLAQWLEVQALEDQKRLHYEKEIMIEDLWNDDKAALKPLPLEDLTVFSLQQQR